MVILETDYIKVTRLSDRLVYVQAPDGIEISGERAASVNKLIADTMQGAYGMIINRSRDYSVDLVPVYNVLNENENLVAIAIVSLREMTLIMAKMEKMLFNRPLELFGSVDEATDWLNKILSGL